MENIRNVITCLFVVLIFVSCTSTESPLLHAGKSGLIEMAEYYLIKGHDIDEPVSSESNKTALFIAVENGKVDFINYALDRGADPNFVSAEGMTPLVRALDLYDSYNIADILIHRGGNPNQRNSQGSTALHVAAYEADVSDVEYLLSKGASPFVRNKLGRTPLHYACIDNASADEDDKIRVVRLLIENRSPLDWKDYDGLSSKDYAIQNNYGSLEESVGKKMSFCRDENVAVLFSQR